jgi:acyl-coenzyme A thioesterase PaaI-like protein
MGHAPAGNHGAATEGVELVAVAARRVVDAVVRAGGAIGSRAESLAARLDDLADEIDAAAPPIAERFAEMWAPGRTRTHDPAAGAQNPIAPPLRLARGDAGEVHGSVTLGWGYQGPAGYVHGGMSALLLDHVLGLSNAWAGAPGMTAHLELDFHRPVPLERPLAVTARQVAVDGRKMRATGTITSEDGVHVTAEGLFLTARRGDAPPNTTAFPEEQRR